MSTPNAIKEITIKGFKSIVDLESFPLRSLNILIGANGTGKSNFISWFRMLREMAEQRLQHWVTVQGGADRIVSYGVKTTEEIRSIIKFGLNEYQFSLQPTVGGDFLIIDDFLFDFESNPLSKPIPMNITNGGKESQLKDCRKVPKNPSDVDEIVANLAQYCYKSITRWKIFHFHDTSNTAGVKRKLPLHDNEYLRSDASNLAAYLYRLREENNETYQRIRKTVRLAIPFFDDFMLKPEQLPTEEKQINLQWKQINSDYPLWPSQLSDGSLRFICLTTAVMQPDPPSTILIDEPELGLHPYAITLLGALIRSAAKRMQVIVSTQSVSLVNEFGVEDIVIVDRQDGATTFNRLDEKELKQWLKDYSLGELWEMNVLGGRPHG
jgi:predicted ATPase